MEATWTFVLATSCYADASSMKTRLAEIIFAEQTHHYGALIGGRALRLIDLVCHRGTS